MNHNKFILTSISSMLTDVASATAGAGAGIETYPLCDYVMQSVFLKMTGAQEQKMKCICWEMATHDYEYRYTRYSKSPLGECSSYEEKKEVYKDLVNQVVKLESKEFDASTIGKVEILKNTSAQVKNAFLGSNLLAWAQKDFNEYVNIWNMVTDKFFANDPSNLFTKTSSLSGKPKSLDQIYNDHLYRHRNRIAHNTLSYQQNLPTLHTLANKNYKYDNYFVYFSILLLIDNIFITLYRRYMHSKESP